MALHYTHPLYVLGVWPSHSGVCPACSDTFLAMMHHDSICSFVKAWEQGLT